MRPNISPPLMVLASKCGRINLIQLQATIYFQFTGFSTLLLYVHMLITTFLLSLCQEEFICNNYAKLFKHSFIIIIIYFTKESFNRLFFFLKFLFNLQRQQKRQQ